VSAVRLCGLALWIGLAVACAGPAERPHVLLVLVDTLRADHVGAYGYPRDTTPNLDAFAREGVLFENARSQAPCTFPSVNSLLTSLHPERFRAGRGGSLGLPDGLPTLPGILRAHGYRTVAVSASPIVRRSPSPHNPEGGFGADFDRFDESCFRTKQAACIHAEALRSLAEAGGPLFLYLHYMDPHDPYRPPGDHPRRFATRPTGRDFVDRGDPNPISRWLYAPPGAASPPLEIGDAEIEHLRDLYDEEIRYFDEQFGRLLGALERRGLRERSIVLLASDHGESFLERRDIKHCRHLHETQIRTPLVLRAPGLAGGRRIPEPAQNLDIVPTLLDLLGIPPEAYGFEGRSLVPWLEGGGDGARPVFGAWGSQRSVVAGSLKLIAELGSDRARLYDLAADPQERHDLVAARPGEVRRLRALLEEHRRAVEPSVSDSAAERLRELGYLE
jgi:arylsulfatase A-like enzyme